jgi:hypothetical protein
VRFRVLNVTLNRTEGPINKFSQIRTVCENIAGTVKSSLDKMFILARVAVLELEGVALWSKGEFRVNTGSKQLVDVRREGLHASTPVRGVLAVAMEVEDEGRGIVVGCEIGRERGPRALNGLLSWRWLRHCDDQGEMVYIMKRGFPFAKVLSRLRLMSTGTVSRSLM